MLSCGGREHWWRRDRAIEGFVLYIRKSTAKKPSPTDDTERCFKAAYQINCNWAIFSFSCNASADIIIGIHVCTGPKSRHDVAERVAQEYSWRRKAQICVSQLFGQPIITQRFHCSVSQIVWYCKNGNPRLSLPGNRNRTERWFEEQKIKKKTPFWRYSLKLALR